MVVGYTMGAVRRMLGVLAALCAVVGAAAARERLRRRPGRAARPTTTSSAATVTVPLDRSGRVPGTVKLHVERAAGQGPAVEALRRGRAKGALVALAGGPGQPATLFTSDFIFAFGSPTEPRHRRLRPARHRAVGPPALPIGREGDAAVAVPGRGRAVRPAARRQARLLHDQRQRRGPRGGAAAIGVDKIAIYGASYGTKVALAYAERYPSHASG